EPVTAAPFFFQAEDGIRDRHVTGVQTCALPIFKRQQIGVNPNLCVGCGACTTVCPTGAISYAYPRPPEQGERLRTLLSIYGRARSEERRVGKAWTAWGCPSRSRARAWEAGRAAR